MRLLPAARPARAKASRCAPIRQRRRIAIVQQQIVDRPCPAHANSADGKPRACPARASEAILDLQFLAIQRGPRVVVIDDHFLEQCSMLAEFGESLSAFDADIPARTSYNACRHLITRDILPPPYQAAAFLQRPDINEFFLRHGWFECVSIVADEIGSNACQYTRTAPRRLAASRTHRQRSRISSGRNHRAVGFRTHRSRYSSTGNRWADVVTVGQMFWPFTAKRQLRIS